MSLRRISESVNAYDMTFVLSEYRATRTEKEDDENLMIFLTSICFHLT